MDISVKLLRRLSKSGKSIQAVLDDGSMIWIPRWCLCEDYQPGERDIILSCRYGRWAEEMIQAEWRKEMTK